MKKYVFKNAMLIGRRQNSALPKNIQ